MESPAKEAPRSRPPSRPARAPSTLKTERAAPTSALFAPALAATLALGAGCDRCSSPKSDLRDAPPVNLPVPPLPSLLPAPKPLTFAKLRGLVDVALPTGCALRSPVVHAPLASSTRFVAEPRTLGALVIADSEGDPPRLTGVSALTLDPEGPTRDPKPIPWTGAESLPRLAVAAGGAWIAAIERASEGPSSRVDLWAGGTASAIGEGDRFEAVDLACSARRCALLTSRLGKVAGAGAAAWIGGAEEPGPSWKRVDIGASAGGSDARPLKIAAVEPGVVVALEERGTCVFTLVEEAGGPREIARVPARHGALDAIAAPLPIALTMATAVDEGGCVSVPSGPSTGALGEPPDGEEASDEASEEGDASTKNDEAPDAEPATVLGTGTAGVRIERQGRPALELRTAAPPLRGALRTLAKGALAVWVAPLGCRQPRRVVYGVMLDERGELIGDVIPISDSSTFAVAASGDSVDLWLEREGSLVWVPMTCAAPPAP